MRNAKLTAIVIVALSLVVLLAGCPSTPDTDSVTPPVDNGGAVSVTVAGNLPLSGDLAIYGESVRNGSELAVKQAGGDVDLQFDWQDNAGEPRQAVSVMQKHFMKTPDLYVMGLKPQSMAILDQVTEKGMPNFPYIFDATIPDRDASTFRTMPTYELEAPMYLEYIEKRQPKRVAILYVNLPHTEEQFKQLVIPNLDGLGVEETMVETFELQTPEFNSIISQAREFKPDLVILNAFPFQLVQIVRAMRSLDVIEDGNTIATFDTIDAGGMLSPEEVEGIRVVSPKFLTQPTEESEQFETDYSSEYGGEPIYLAAYAYDMVQIMLDAATRVPADPTNEQWMQALNETDISGVTGPLEFDDDGDIMTPLDIGVFRDGQLVSASSEAPGS
jgi:branched-chain amino acid transport system substrate-binding protein